MKALRFEEMKGRRGEGAARCEEVKGDYSPLHLEKNRRGEDQPRRRRTASESSQEVSLVGLFLLLEVRSGRRLPFR
jgi:hypothetical protein